MGTVYIGLGANLGEPVETVQAAITAISAWPEVRALKPSSLYKTHPLGPQNQPDYINAAVCLETDMSPEQLLDRLQELEQEHGRERNLHWGPRTLDLDILLSDDLDLSSDRLEIPHPEIANRGFVLAPLLELSPSLVHPATGETVEALYCAWRRSVPDPDREVRRLETP
jgi:2-amino-4-hydroxy-6-hydroxymethyldihydropteridine diphosphokinase